MSELERAFVTPFDREDILALAYEHDDTVAELVATADLMVLLCVGDRLPGFPELAAVVARAMANVGSGLRALRNLESASFARLSLRVTSLVEEGQRLGWRMTADLLRPGDGQPNGRAETSAGVALIGSTLLGAPVSTTHVVTGAISGVGAVHRRSAVRWPIVARVAWAWLLTIPVAGLLGAVGYRITTAPVTVLAALVLVAILAGLAVTMFRRAPRPVVSVARS